MRRKPYSVVLLDEIEKAHPDVFNILLQILEDGKLTDAQGRKVDFRNTIVIMTSNIGAATISKNQSLGFSVGDDTGLSYDEMKDRIMGELKKVFRPELLNRIDEVIVFHKLTKDEIKTIVDLMMKRLREQMVEHEAAIELPRRRRSCSSTRATTRRWAPGRCAARSSASSRTARGLRPRPLDQARLDHRRRQEGRRGRGRHLDRRGRGPAGPEPGRSPSPPRSPRRRRTATSLPTTSRCR